MKKIDSNQLSEIISKSVKKVLTEHYLIDPCSIESSCLDNPPVYLEEGLIKTYPIDRSIKALANVYDLKVTDSVKDFPPIIKDNNTNGCICIDKRYGERIAVCIEDNEHNLDIVSHYLEKYGYSKSALTPLNDEWMIYYFDKKFDEDVTDIVKYTGEVYHICPMKVKDKILKQGITPRTSQWSGFENNERCYFFLRVSMDRLEKWIMNFKMKKHQYNEKYMILKIDVNELPEDMKFYLDPRIENGVYSLQGIPPTAIEIIKENINGIL